MKLEEYEILKGKPHGGLWMGTYLLLNNMQSFSDLDPICVEAKIKLENWKFLSFPDLEHRNCIFIYKPPYYGDPFNSTSTIAIKLLVWGRAFKIMKFCKIGKKSYKKKYVSGRRKLVRIR